MNGGNVHQDVGGEKIDYQLRVAFMQKLSGRWGHGEPNNQSVCRQVFKEGSWWSKWWPDLVGPRGICSLALSNIGNPSFSLFE